MWDWWKVRELHTPLEWAIQCAAEQLEPTGEDRADLRAAHNVAHLLSALVVGTEITPDLMGEWKKDLRYYLASQQVEEVTVTPEEVEAAKHEQQ